VGRGELRRDRRCSRWAPGQTEASEAAQRSRLRVRRARRHGKTVGNRKRGATGRSVRIGGLAGGGIGGEAGPGVSGPPEFAESPTTTKAGGEDHSVQGHRLAHLSATSISGP
jgi:hypothetical protein